MVEWGGRDRGGSGGGVGGGATKTNPDAVLWGREEGGTEGGGGRERVVGFLELEILTVETSFVCLVVHVIYFHFQNVFFSVVPRAYMLTRMKRSQFSRAETRNVVYD